MFTCTMRIELKHGRSLKRYFVKWETVAVRQYNFVASRKSLYRNRNRILFFFFSRALFSSSLYNVFAFYICAQRKLSRLCHRHNVWQLNDIFHIHIFHRQDVHECILFRRHIPAGSCTCKKHTSLRTFTQVWIYLDAYKPTRIFTVYSIL